MKVLCFSAAQTAVAAWLWKVVMTFAQLEHDYPPEVRAAAHIHRPRGLVGMAVFMTFSAVGCWVLAILTAERD